MREPSSEFVLQRRMSAAAIVGSFHEVLGPLFLERFVGADENADYGLAADVNRAHRFDSDDVDTDDFLRRVLDCSTRLDGLGDFDSLSASVGISATELVEWATNTVWIEIRTPSMLLFLRRFDGCIKRWSEWARDLFLAHRFGPSAVSPAGEFGAIRRYGRIVPILAAYQSLAPQPPRVGRVVNHGLEADAAWAEWRLSQRFGLSDAKARGRALKHAGTTGWHTAGLDRANKHSFDYSAELRRAFDLGRSLFLCSQRQFQITFGEQQC
jgi:hypothetical protein